MKKFRLVSISCFTILILIFMSCNQIAKAKCIDLNAPNNFLISSNTTSSEIIIPDTVTSIGPWAYANNKEITKVVIPDSVVTIDVAAFCGCTNLEEIEIPASVTTIRSLAFADTAWLAKQQSLNPLVTVNGILVDGRAATGDITIPNTINHINESAFSGNSKLLSVDIPSKSRISIGVGAFSFCYNLKKVTMTDSVISIGEEAFYGCEALTSIKLSNSLTQINSALFEKCKSLRSITIPSSVKEICESAFRHCRKLTYISVPNSVEAIYELAFGSCSSKLTFYGNNNSYVSAYASNNNFKYKTLALVKSKASISKGDFLQLYMNSSATCKWKSSNPKIASVNSTGKVIAKKKGTVTISAILYGKTYKCTVIVK